MAQLTNEEKGSVRMGPITLISLAIVLSLAVLAALSFTTARASNTQAERQAEATAEAYANERAGQNYLATVDAILAQTAKAKGSKADALNTIKAASPDVAVISGDSIRITFSNAGKRLLNIEIAINDNLTYTVTKWKTSVTWDQSYVEQANIWRGTDGN